MSLCMIFSCMSLLVGAGLEQSANDGTAPTLEHRLELFEWVRGCRAIGEGQTDRWWAVRKMACAGGRGRRGLLTEAGEPDLLMPKSWEVQG
jgi:hypothetical protein